MERDAFLALEGAQEYIDRLASMWELEAIFERGIVEGAIYAMAGMHFASIRTRMRSEGKIQSLGLNDEEYIKALCFAAHDAWGAKKKEQEESHV